MIHSSFENINNINLKKLEVCNSIEVKCVNTTVSLYDYHTDKSHSESYYIKPNLDCIYTFSMDLAPNRIAPLKDSLRGAK